MKQIFDILLGLAMLVLLEVLMLFIAITIQKILCKAFLKVIKRQGVSH
jgi:hypothetical protein